MACDRPIVLVAAMARDRIIGHQGAMPWHLPADLAHFKAVTMGHPVVMGRKTFESIGRALPGRKNIVITRSQPSLPREVVRASSLDESMAALPPSEPVMIIGGGQIYAEALPRATRLELTLIDAAVAGDTRFPALDLQDWQVQSVCARPADAKNPYPLRFVSFERVGSPASS